MHNILVPTDFSPLSKVAVQFAIQIANDINTSVTLLHVIQVSDPVRSVMQENVRAVQKELIENAEADMDKVIKEVLKKVDTKKAINRVAVRSYDFSDGLKKEAKRMKASLIVMGTKGASGLKKTVVGSNTASVIEESDIPVIAVPDRAKFKGFKDIVYASDLKNPEKELKIILTYAEKFRSIVHFIHVARKGDDVEALDEKMEKIVAKQKAKNVVNIVLVDSDIEGAIDQYLSVSKATLLCMFTHNLTFFEKLFDRSITRAMAFQSKVPLLAFKQKR